MSDLVERLRGLCKTHIPTCCEAADRIAALEAERETLKDLLATYTAAANDAEAETIKVEAERDKVTRDAQHALDVLGMRVHELEAALKTAADDLADWGDIEASDHAHALLSPSPEAAARIVALEAERDAQRSWEGAAKEYEEQARFARAQTAIVETERDALRKALEEIAGTAEIGLNIGPVIRLAARALLSPPEGGAAP